MTKSLEIDGIRFRTKTEGIDYCRAILARYGRGDIVLAADAKFLRELLKGHPKYIAKVGSGIDHFEVRAVKYGALCFHVVRTDGSSDNFSYKQCL